MYFDLGRTEGFPAIYGPNRTPVTVDVLEVGLIVAAVILALSFYISMLSSRILESIYLYTRITLSILIGALILLGNYGQEWEVAHIKSKTPYKAGTHAEINATIGVKIGLRSVNITLQSIVDPNGPLKQEVIDYNERFEWTWEQGSFGFGPYAGHLQQEFRAAQYRGVPTPILWIADYFVIDGEGFRHGRFYRTAGWYAHIAIWCAFPCWLLANLFFRSVIRYGGYCLGLSGIFQLIGIVLWLSIRNPRPLSIPFEDGAIVMKYGSSFWLTVISGILCMLLCIAIVLAEYIWTFQLYNFFGISALNNTDEKYLTYEEVNTHYNNEQAITEEGSEVQEMLIRHRDSNRSRVSRGNSFIVRVKKNTHIAITPPVPSYIEPAHTQPSTSSTAVQRYRNPLEAVVSSGDVQPPRPPQLQPIGPNLPPVTPKKIHKKDYID